MKKREESNHQCCNNNEYGVVNVLNLLTKENKLKYDDGINLRRTNKWRAKREYISFSEGYDCRSRKKHCYR